MSCVCVRAWVRGCESVGACVFCCVLLCHSPGLLIELRVCLCVEERRASLTGVSISVCSPGFCSDAGRRSCSDCCGGCWPCVCASSSSGEAGTVSSPGLDTVATGVLDLRWRAGVAGVGVIAARRALAAAIWVTLAKAVAPPAR